MEPWEDELLWDDDFSDEEEDTEEQIESCKQKSIAEMKKVPQNLRDRKRA